VALIGSAAMQIHGPADETVLETGRMRENQ